MCRANGKTKKRVLYRLAHRQSYFYRLTGKHKLTEQITLKFRKSHGRSQGYGSSVGHISVCSSTISSLTTGSSGFTAFAWFCDANCVSRRSSCNGEEYGSWHDIGSILSLIVIYRYPPCLANIHISSTSPPPHCHIICCIPNQSISPYHLPYPTVTTTVPYIPPTVSSQPPTVPPPLTL